ncbi:MAG: hypothetical protein AAGD07_21695 [Planctomycetota bacterium]
MTETDSVPKEQESNDPPTEPKQSPGCLPGILAATLLMGMVFFITCGVTTWVLFGKRTEFAIRTLEGVVPEIEQSRMQTEDKKEVIAQLSQLTSRMRDTDYAPAKASAVMQRIVRIPLVQWGELDAVEAFAKAGEDEAFAEEASRHLSRVRYALKTSKVTVIDINDILAPVTEPAQSLSGHALITPLDLDAVRDTIQRADLLADRAEIDDVAFPAIGLAEILANEITIGESQD